VTQTRTKFELYLEEVP